MSGFQAVVRWCLAIAIGASQALIAIDVHAASGALDAAFGSAGIARTRIAPSSDYASSVAVQADGKIVVAGASQAGSSSDADFALARYNFDGTLDSTFGVGGRVVTPIGSGDDWALAVAIQSDGKIVAGGYSFNGTNNDFALLRYNADGSLDASFGTGGKVVTPSAAGGDAITGIAIQKTDGKILVSGYVSNGTNTDFAVARYNTNGTLDASFAGGRVITPFGSGNDYATAVAIQGDGKIVASGFAAIGANNVVALARYTTLGALDATFNPTGTPGKVTTAIGTSSRAYALAFQGDGKIVVAGQSDSKFAVARYTTAGVLDTSGFNAGGPQPGTNTAIIGTDDYAVGLAFMFDGRIVAAGSAFNGSNSYDFGYARFNTDGTPSTTGPSDPAAKAIIVSNNWDRLGGMAAVPGGDLVFVGESFNGANYDFAVVRTSAFGFPDSSFGTNGLVRTEFYNYGFGGWNAIARQSDGKTVAAGYANNGVVNQFALARFKADGGIDASFGDGGRVVTAMGTSTAVANAVVIQADGKIVAGGYSYNGTNFDFALARYNTDGSLDTSFGSGGRVATPIGSVDEQINGLALQSDGKIVAVGVVGSAVAASDFALARYTTTGALDTSFNSTGKVTTDISGADVANAVAIQADGKIVVAGSALSGVQRFALARYTTAGALDATFNPTGTPGKTTTSFASGDEARALLIRPDGFIVAAGRSLGSISPTYSFALARYSPVNGALDASFGSAGKVTTPIGNGAGIQALALQSNGNLLAAGYSVNASGDTDFALARYLDANGALDTTFGSAGTLTTPVGTGDDKAFALALQPDGRAVAAGSATGNGPAFTLAGYVVSETPTAFSFAPVSGVAFGATVVSGTVTISGLSGPAIVSVVNGQYSIGCTGTFVSTPGSISNGATICVRHTAAAFALGSAATTLYVGAASATFTSTAYGFAAVRRAAPAAVITSETITLAGFAGTPAISISGGTYSRNGGPFVATGGSVSNGDTLQLRLTSSVHPSTRAAATLTIGGLSAQFVAVTRADLAAGIDNNVAISPAGEVWSWGGNTDAKLGNGSTTSNSSTPVRALGLTGVTAVAAGMAHTLAVRNDGTVWAWGENNQGRLGNNDAVVDQCGFQDCAKKPVQVPGIADALTVSAGWGHTLVLKADGKVLAWGYNSTLQVGDGTTASTVGTPQQVIESSGAPLSNVVAIAAGYFHSVALKADGTVWTWGYNFSGELGIGASASQNRAQQVTSLSGVVAISAKGSSTLALMGDGTVKAWGQDFYGQLGDGASGVSTNKNLPVQVKGVGGIGFLTGVQSIAAGWSFGMARMGDGTVMTWGLNNTGQLGDGTTTNRTLPVAATQYGTASAIVGGGAHGLAVSAAGVIVARGNNASGQLGDQSGNFGTGYYNSAHDPGGTVVPQIEQPTYTSVGTPSSSGMTLAAIDAGVAFPPQPVGTPSATRQLLFRNNYSLPISVSGIGVASSDFSQTNTCGSSLAASSSCTIDVTFTPAAGGARSAALTISSGSSDGSLIAVQLNGTGLATTTLALTTSSATPGFGQPVTFTATLSGSASPTGTMTFKDGATTLTSVGVSGAATQYATNTLALGAHSITAQYSGDAVNTASASSAVSVTVVSTPTVPAGLLASAVSSSQINLSWSASTDAGGVTQYKVYRDTDNYAVPIATVNAPALAYQNTGLAALTAYAYKVSACNAAASCSAQSASASATTLAAGQVGYTPNYVAGFNLDGNPFTTPLSVSALFGSGESPVFGVSDRIESVWTWNAATGKWKIHLPQLIAPVIAAYAAANNFEVLTSVPPGAGYWVSASVPVTLAPRSGLPFAYAKAQFDLLPNGVFNLLASGSTRTAAQFNTDVGTAPTNFVALWVWDAVRTKWYFHSPQFGLPGAPFDNAFYCAANNFLDFAGGTPPAPALNLQPGVGFWVEKN